MIVGEMNTPRLLRVMIDEVHGRLQGACVPFIDGGGLRAETTGLRSLRTDRSGSARPISRGPAAKGCNA